MFQLRHHHSLVPFCGFIHTFTSETTCYLHRSFNFQFVASYWIQIIIGQTFLLKQLQMFLKAITLSVNSSFIKFCVFEWRFFHFFSKISLSLSIFILVKFQSFTWKAPLLIAEGFPLFQRTAQNCSQYCNGWRRSHSPWPRALLLSSFPVSKVMLIEASKTLPSDRFS